MKCLAGFLFLGVVAALPMREHLDKEELLHAIEARNEAALPTREYLDEEELLHAIEARNEAMQMEVDFAEAEAESRHYVEPAPPQEGRRIGLGLGVQLGPLGAGVSTGLGNAGLGYNFLNYGTPAHYSQYYSKPVQVPVHYNYGASLTAQVPNLRRPHSCNVLAPELACCS